MKKRFFWTLSIVIVVVALLMTGAFSWQNLRGIMPAIQQPEQDIATMLPKTETDDKQLETSVGAGENSTNFPLTLPVGFSISIFAKNLPNARMIAFDSFGNLWLSRTTAGTISMLEIKDGLVVRQNDILRNLNKPHGIAFDPENPLVLYYAEENKISRVTTYSDETPQKIADLPSGAGHSTRTLLFDDSGKLHVSIGSSCNVCKESNSQRAKIFSSNKDGSNMQEVAAGLRNSVFMINHPTTGKIWATDMGRDLLGDNIPPDEINIISQGGNYGWPYCYSNNIHDDNFDSRQTVACQNKIAPRIEIQAHSAPLGLAFVPENSNWPAEYKNNLLVAFHGSWNRSIPTGYKIVRYELDAQGNSIETRSEAKDFITGWLSGKNALGRPVDIKFKDDDMFVSDDLAGVIYKITYQRK
jgi:glucose/arabinose dehydrogenase